MCHPLIISTIRCRSKFKRKKKENVLGITNNVKKKLSYDCQREIDDQILLYISIIILTITKPPEPSRQLANQIWRPTWCKIIKQRKWQTFLFTLNINYCYFPRFYICKPNKYYKGLKIFGVQRRAVKIYYAD